MVSYEEGRKAVVRGLILLSVITIVEVLFALAGNGHIVEGWHFPKWIMYLVMIAFSLYKAKFIVFEFMHMAHEVKGLAMSVLLPMLLLVWAVIAFMQEGNSYLKRREQIEQKNAIVPGQKVVKPQGLLHRADTKWIG